MRATSARPCRGSAGATRPDGWTVACAAHARAHGPDGPDDDESVGFSRVMMVIFRPFGVFDGVLFALVFETIIAQVFDY